MDSLTHIFVTEQAVKLTKIKALEDNIKDLTKWATQPDKDDTSGAYLYHFYNPATGKNFHGGNITALSRMLMYYKQAKVSINNNQGDNTCEYIESLGRCLHFLQDLNTPVHTFYEDSLDATSKLSKHLFFEKYCNKISELKDEGQKEGKTNILDEYKVINFESFVSNDVENIVKYYILKSSKLLKELNNDKENTDKVAKEAIENCVISSAGIIYKLFN